MGEFELFALRLPTAWVILAQAVSDKNITCQCVRELIKMQHNNISGFALRMILYCPDRTDNEPHDLAFYAGEELFVTVAVWPQGVQQLGHQGGVQSAAMLIHRVRIIPPKT